LALLKLTTFTNQTLIYYEKTYLIAAILLLSMKSFSQGSPITDWNEIQPE
jgi:hypothetical protein